MNLGDEHDFLWFEELQQSQRKLLEANWKWSLFLSEHSFK